MTMDQSLTQSVRGPAFPLLPVPPLYGYRAAPGLPTVGDFNRALAPLLYGIGLGDIVNIQEHVAYAAVWWNSPDFLFQKMLNRNLTAPVPVKEGSYSPTGNKGRAVAQALSPRVLRDNLPKVLGLEYPVVPQGRLFGVTYGLDLAGIAQPLPREQRANQNPMMAMGLDAEEIENESSFARSSAIQAWANPLFGGDIADGQSMFPHLNDVKIIEPTVGVSQHDEINRRIYDRFIPYRFLGQDLLISRGVTFTLRAPGSLTGYLRYRDAVQLATDFRDQFLHPDTITVVDQAMLEALATSLDSDTPATLHLFADPVNATLAQDFAEAAAEHGHTVHLAVANADPLAGTTRLQHSDFEPEDEEADTTVSTTVAKDASASITPSALVHVPGTPVTDFNHGLAWLGATPVVVNEAAHAEAFIRIPARAIGTGHNYANLGQGAITLPPMGAMPASLELPDAEDLDPGDLLLRVQIPAGAAILPQATIAAQQGTAAVGAQPARLGQITDDLLVPPNAMGRIQVIGIGRLSDQPADGDELTVRRFTGDLASLVAGVPQAGTAGVHAPSFALSEAKLVTIDVSSPSSASTQIPKVTFTAPSPPASIKGVSSALVTGSTVSTEVTDLAGASGAVDVVRPGGASTAELRTEPIPTLSSPAAFTGLAQVPADGRCLLYSAIVTAPTSIYEALRSADLLGGNQAAANALLEPDRLLAHAARLAQLRSNTGQPVNPNSPLAATADALSTLVLRYLNQNAANLPDEITRLRPGLNQFETTRAAQLDRPALLTELRQAGLQRVESADFLPLATIRDQYITNRTQHLIGTGQTPQAAATQAQGEVAFNPGTSNLADNARNLQRQLDYLHAPDGGQTGYDFTLDSLSDTTLRAYLVETRAQRTGQFDTTELDWLRTAIQNWERYWATEPGDFLMPLLANALGARFRIVRYAGWDPDTNQVAQRTVQETRYGPQGGFALDLHYNGATHYNGSDTTPATVHVAPDILTTPRAAAITEANRLLALHPVNRYPELRAYAAGLLRTWHQPGTLTLDPADPAFQLALNQIQALYRAHGHDDAEQLAIHLATPTGAQPQRAAVETLTEPQIHTEARRLLNTYNQGTNGNKNLVGDNYDDALDEIADVLREYGRPIAETLAKHLGSPNSNPRLQGALGAGPGFALSTDEILARTADPDGLASGSESGFDSELEDAGDAPPRLRGGADVLEDWRAISKVRGVRRSDALQQIDAAVAQVVENPDDLTAFQALDAAITAWRGGKDAVSVRDTAIGQLEERVALELARLAAEEPEAEVSTDEFDSGQVSPTDLRMITSHGAFDSPGVLSGQVSPAWSRRASEALGVVKPTEFDRGVFTSQWVQIGQRYAGLRGLGETNSPFRTAMNKLKDLLEADGTVIGQGRRPSGLTPAKTAVLDEVISHLESVHGFEVMHDWYRENQNNPGFLDELVAEALRAVENGHLWSKLNVRRSDKAARLEGGVYLEGSLAGFIFNGIHLGFPWGASPVFSELWDRLSGTFVSHLRGMVNADVYLGIDDTSVLTRTEWERLKVLIAQGRVNGLQVNIFKFVDNQFRLIDHVLVHSQPSFDLLPKVPGDAEWREGQRNINAHEAMFAELENRFRDLDSLIRQGTLTVSLAPSPSASRILTQHQNTLVGDAARQQIQEQTDNANTQLKLLLAELRRTDTGPIRPGLARTNTTPSVFSLTGHSNPASQPASRKPSLPAVPQTRPVAVDGLIAQRAEAESALATALEQLTLAESTSGPQRLAESSTLPNPVGRARQTVVQARANLTAIDERLKTAGIDVAQIQAQQAAKRTQAGALFPAGSSRAAAVDIDEVLTRTADASQAETHVESSATEAVVDLPAAASGAFSASVATDPLASIAHLLAGGLSTRIPPEVAVSSAEAPASSRAESAVVPGRRLSVEVKNLTDVSFQVRDKLAEEQFIRIDADLRSADLEVVQEAQRAVAELGRVFAGYIRDEFDNGNVPTPLGHSRLLIQLGTDKAPFAGAAFGSALAAQLGRRIAIGMGSVATRIEVCPPENGG